MLLQQKGIVMITAPDFNKKQIIFVFCSNGEKIQIKNDNLVVTDKEGNTKIQVTCYRLFLVNIIGNCSLTTVLINKAKKFGFYIALYTYGFHLYQILGAAKEGNTLLKVKQYTYNELTIAQKIVKNKIVSQLIALKSIRNKDNNLINTIKQLKVIYSSINDNSNLQELLTKEGNAAKIYFKCMFNNVDWHGRKPRIKLDMVNSTLDIGYTMLFNYLDAILSCFGFDTYVGVYHKQFYMRKSLVCDIIEPFRPIIDKTIRNAINLKQIKESDFNIVNEQYKLRIDLNAKYIEFLVKPIIENRDEIFRYVQKYYRCFMKEDVEKDFPFFTINGGTADDIDKL